MKISNKKKLTLSLIALSTIIIPTSGLSETRYEYDKLGRLVKVEYKNAQGSKYFYDAAGNRASTVTDNIANIDQLNSPPKPTNLITLPMGGLSVIIF